MAHPGQAAHLLGGDVRRGTHLPLQPVRSGTRSRDVGISLRPASEARLEGLELLSRALVGVGHDALLAAGEGRPACVARLIAQARHWMAGDGPGQLLIALFSQPASPGITVTEWLERVVGRQKFVHVVEQGRALHDAAVHVDASHRDALGQEGGDLRHGR